MSSSSQNCSARFKQIEENLTESVQESVCETAAETNERFDDGEEESLLFQDYFLISERKNDEKKNIAAMCKICDKSNSVSTPVRGSLLATSNFTRHLKVVF